MKWNLWIVLSQLIPHTHHKHHVYRWCRILGFPWTSIVNIVETFTPMFTLSGWLHIPWGLFHCHDVTIVLCRCAVDPFSYISWIPYIQHNGLNCIYFVLCPLGWYSHGTRDCDCYCHLAMPSHGNKTVIYSWYKCYVTVTFYQYLSWLKHVKTSPSWMRSALNLMPCVGWQWWHTYWGLCGRCHPIL